MLGFGDEIRITQQLYADAARGLGFAGFLGTLCTLTQARAASLTVEAGGEPHLCTTDPAPPPLPAESLRALRSDRLYDQSEMGRPAPLRVMRLRPDRGVDAWLVLWHPHADFRAIDGALLSRLAPHLAQSVALWLDAVERDAGGAESALAALGACTFWLDAQARVQGPVPPALATTPGLILGADQRLSLTADPNRLRRALDTLATRPLVIPEVGLILYPGAQSPSPRWPPVFRAALRTAPTPGEAETLATALALEPNEARLALLLARGQTLAQAAQTCGWTLGTARSYSKRLFARTGTQGQADLVRLILSGPWPLATLPFPARAPALPVATARATR